MGTAVSSDSPGPLSSGSACLGCEGQSAKIAVQRGIERRSRRYEGQVSERSGRKEERLTIYSASFALSITGRRTDLLSLM